jgi:hypothetical protein
MAEWARQAEQSGQEDEANDPVRKQPLFFLALKHMVAIRVERLVNHG